MRSQRESNSREPTGLIALQVGRGQVCVKVVEEGLSGEH